MPSLAKFGFILIIIVIGYFSLSDILLSNLPFDYTTISSRIDSIIQQTWDLEIESISDIQNKTVAIIENRTGLTLDITKKEMQIEHKVHQLINEERKSNGLSALEFAEDLSLVSKLHSLDMSANKFFSHENLDGQTPTDRGADLKYYCIKIKGIYVTSGIGENIFMINSTNTFWHQPDEIAKRAVNGWMNSEGHRKNILNVEYELEGIGVIISDSSIHITQNFC